MKKRGICALLSALLLSAGMLSACNSDTEKYVSAASNVKTRTVTLLAITDESTTEEGIARAEALMNTISKSSYKTQVKLVLKTADEYEDYINTVYDYQNKKKEEEDAAAKKARQEAKDKKAEAASIAAASKIKSKWVEKDSTEEVTTEEPEETVLDEYGRQVLKYSDAEEYQADIIFMTGVDMFRRFYNKGYLQEISEELRSSSNAKKDLSKYIYPTFYKAGQIDEAIYAYTNNHLIDEYTYLLIDKTLANKYNFHPTSVTQITDCEAFLDQVKANEPGYVPMNEMPEMAYTYVFGEGVGIAGAIMDDLYHATTRISLTNLFTDDRVINYYGMKDKCEQQGYLSSGNSKNERYAIEVVKGYYNSPETENWDDNYYVVTYEKPVNRNSSVYAGMYGISTYSKNPERALEIINLLNTSPNFINAYAYGLEGTDYTLNEDGTVHLLNAGYSMNLDYCGNSYMAYVPEGKPADLWEISKVQNQSQYTAIDSPFLGMCLESSEKMYQDTLTSYKSVNDSYVTQLLNSTDKAGFLRSRQDSLSRNFAISLALSEAEATSLYSLYTTYHQSLYPTD